MVKKMEVMIGVGTSSDTNNSLDGNKIDECLRNNEKNESNEASFSLHYTHQQIACFKFC
jgi:hypothetical protein